MAYSNVYVTIFQVAAESLQAPLPNFYRSEPTLVHHVVFYSFSASPGITQDSIGVSSRGEKGEFGAVAI